MFVCVTERVLCVLRCVLIKQSGSAKIQAPVREALTEEPVDVR